MKKTAVKAIKEKKAPAKLKKAAKVNEATDDVMESRPVRKNKFDAKTRNEFRSMLLKLRDRLTGQMSTLRNESLSRDDVVDLAEDGTDAFERQFALSLVSSEQESVFEIDEALKRLEDETYGLCEQCDAHIGSLRLKALPFVKMCVECQSGFEKSKHMLRPLQALKGL